MDQRRLRILKPGKEKKGIVAYWMSRDQRADDNWALLFAREMSLAFHVPLVVIFCLVPRFLEARARQYLFMLKGLQEVEKDLATQNVPFFLLTGSPEKEIPAFVKHHDVSHLVTDFDPLRIKQAWKKKVGEKITIPFSEVDAHNIVPCWIASQKQEYGARTLRPKIRRLLPEFLTPFPKLKKHPYPLKNSGPSTNWNQIFETIKVDKTVPEVHWLKPGETAAKKVFLDFLRSKLAHYDRLRNDPTQDGQSHLSPYLHFGQLSAQRIALNVMRSNAPPAAEEAFLEELIVRRELADNFCFYNSSYDSFKGFPLWAKATLHDHRKDPRAYSYTLKELENAQTHDELWNAAQREMARTSGIDAGVFANPVWFGTNGIAYNHESGSNLNSEAVFAESGPFEIGAGDTTMMASMLIPDEKTRGQVTVTFKTRFYPNDTERSYGPYSMAAPTDVRFTGRQVAMRVTGAANDSWRWGVPRIDAIPGGRR